MSQFFFILVNPLIYELQIFFHKLLSLNNQLRESQFFFNWYFNDIFDLSIALNKK